MATTNIWKKFSSLLPTNSRTVVTIISNNANGTSTAQMRDGTLLTLEGESVSPGKKALVNDSIVLYEIPTLTIFRRDV
ncbi:hypothetical protein GCM10023116_00840 [Kistimonas scapharcae]|uniref:Uncharacterized protein n=1 Tax=Kistimonas scapharcae TaxID=1036133 RepID=A0ABP8UZ72_9GAMM